MAYWSQPQPLTTQVPYQSPTVTPLQPTYPTPPIRPSGVLAQKGDLIAIGVWSSIAVAIPIIAAFGIVYSDGSTETIVTPPFPSKTDKSQSSNNSVISIKNDGIIVSGAIEAFPTTSGANDPIQPGQMFMLAQLVNAGDTVVKATLLSDYFYEGHQPDMRRLIGSTDGPGFINTIVSATTPAAGAEIAEVVPANVRWNLRSFSSVLVTDGNVANRNIVLIIDNGTSTKRKRIFGETAATNITATLTRTIQYTQGADTASAVFQSVTDTQTVLYKACFPPGGITLVKGDKIRTKTANIQVGDQYAAPIYEVEEWLTGP